jgi:hypothetical protein
MVPGTEGGITKYFANGKGEEMSIFDAAMKYSETNTPLVILAGARVRHRFIARLGREGDAFVRGEGGCRCKL